MTRKGSAALLIVGCLLCLWAAAPAEALGAQVYLDGKPVDYGEPLRFEEGRILVPMRSLIESLGGQVDWRPETRTVEARFNGVHLAMPAEKREIQINAMPVLAELPARIIQDRTYLPLRFVGETFGFGVLWVGEERSAYIASPAAPRMPEPEPPQMDPEKLYLMGDPYVTLEHMQAWFDMCLPEHSDLPGLYYGIAGRYGVRPDLAIAQALWETGFMGFGGLVKPDQNNLCGLYATGTILTGNESVYGADPERVFLVPGTHGATFADRATGVEAHIQHLYGYATKADLPPGTVLLSPRFNLLSPALRGSAPVIAYLGATDNPTGIGWAYPGDGYGTKIVQHVYRRIVNMESR